MPDPEARNAHRQALATPFVFGHSRSGTSLLTAMLARHSQIAMLPETHLLSALQAELLPNAHEQFLLFAWDRLRTRMGDLRLPPDEILARFCSHACSPEGLLQTLLELWAEHEGKPVAGEKTPSHLRFADRMLAAIPESRAIILIRDGRAVVAAMRRTALHAETPAEQLVDSWVRSAELCDRWLCQFPERSRLVRFEDLVTAPERSLQLILEWLGAPFEPAMLHPGPTSTFRRWEDYAKQDVVRPIMPAKAQAWTEGADLLTPDLLGQLAPWLNRFGYHTLARIPAAPAERRAPEPPRFPPKTGIVSRPPLLLVGAHRAGTASLNAWLGTHPEVSPAAPRPRPWLALNWPLSREALLHQLATEAEGPCHPERVLCHAASYYLAHPDLPRRVHQLLPEAKIFVVLRDPVQRAFSHWLHAWRIGVETLAFDDAIEAELHRVGEAESTLKTQEHAANFRHVHYSYEIQGRYATLLERWLSAIPPANVLVLFLEDLIADGGSAWERICDHAGVGRVPATPFPREMALPWPLPAEAVRLTRGGSMLRTALREETSRLADLLQQQLPWV